MCLCNPEIEKCRCENIVNTIERIVACLNQNTTVVASIICICTRSDSFYLMNVSIRVHAVSFIGEHVISYGDKSINEFLSIQWCSSVITINVPTW